MATGPERRQRSLLEFGAAPVTLHTCPCCLGKTARDPADILREVEAGRKAKEIARAIREHTRDNARAESSSRMMQTHVPVPRQSPKTGKWLDSVEWIPKIMLQTSWMIPSRVFHRMVAGFQFDKAHGCDVLAFRGKHATSRWMMDEVTGTKRLVTTVEHFTLWDVLASAFKPGDEGGL
nr:hypothetical protein [Candidatus Sigynarchaeum springense]